jgi:hypothetical protein
MKVLRILLSSILLLTSILLGSAMVHTPVAFAVCDNDTWCIVTTPNSSGVHNYLYDVEVVGVSDVWAVGYTKAVGTNGVETAIAQHYDGTSWTSSSISVPNSYHSTLYGVAAYASNDVWAVGDYTTTSDGLSAPLSCTGTVAHGVKSLAQTLAPTITNATR